MKEKWEVEREGEGRKEREEERERQRFCTMVKLIMTSLCGGPELQIHLAAHAQDWTS